MVERNAPSPIAKGSGYRPEDTRIPRKVRPKLTAGKLLEALRLAIEPPKPIFGDPDRNARMKPTPADIKATVFFRGVPDRDLMDLFIKVHVQGVDKGTAFLDMIPVFEKLGYRKQRITLDVLACVVRQFIENTAEFVEVLEDPNTALTDREKVFGNEELDLEREYRELLALRKGLLQQLDTENSQAPLIVYFDKKDKALSGLESTLGSVAKFQQMIGKLASTNLVLTHRIDSAVQTLLDVPSTEKAAMKAAALSMVQYLEGVGKE